MTSSRKRRLRRSVNQPRYKEIGQSTSSDKQGLPCQEPVYVQYTTCGNSAALDFKPNTSYAFDLCPIYRQPLGKSTWPTSVCRSDEYYTTDICLSNMPVVGHEHQSRCTNGVHVTTKCVVRGKYHVQCAVLHLVTLVSAAEIRWRLIYSFIV